MKVNLAVKKYLKEMTLIALSVIIGFFSTLYINEAKEPEVDTIQEGLSSSLIRFHVIANSDTEEDQALKLKARDAVLEEMTQWLETSESIDETRQILKDQMAQIQTIVETVIKDHHKAYSVSVSLENDFFPTKAYGDVILPTGEYEALKIVIGEGEGKNWWCVMFPPLCFVDVTHGVVEDESKERLKAVLTEEEYENIISLKKEEDIPVKIKFKLFEVINENQENKRTGVMANLLGWTY